jgi:sulfur carrier protein
LRLRAVQVSNLCLNSEFFVEICPFKMEFASALAGFVMTRCSFYWKEFNMTVKLVLRGKEYEVKPGMTLLDSLKKINVLSESVLAVRNGEMILDDEILKDGEVIKLVAVISGGAE